MLAVLPPGPIAAGFSQFQQGLLLNMLQMWCTLLLGTLQREAMADWHVYGDIARPCQWIGLNLACPLHRGEPGKFVNWRETLKESEDPMARDYAVDVLHARRKSTEGMTPAGQIWLGAFVAVFVVILLSLTSQPSPIKMTPLVINKTFRLGPAAEKY